VHEPAATEVFHRDCLIRLGSVLAPTGAGRPGQPCVTVEVRAEGQPTVDRRVPFGELTLLPLPVEGRAHLVAAPERGFDLGAGKGRPLETDLRGGACGLIVDTRGRHPFQLPSDGAARIASLRRWNKALGVYARDI
jgi:hypothetical protein